MQLTVSSDPIRLDRFLATTGPYTGLGRRALAAVLDTGGVRVNGKRARKGTIVRPGDTITMEPRASPPAPAIVRSPLAVLHVDDDVVAVDKRPGLPTTTGRAPGPTLAEALIARFPEMAGFGDPRHAGLVHRLDTGTSGVLLAARKASVYTRLRTAFARKRAVKDYLAVVAGRLDDEHRVTLPLARHARSRGRMVPARSSQRAWPAETEVVPIDVKRVADGAFTVVRLRMRTGVTHQLRVHLASLGHPIVGDRRYGDTTTAAALGLPLPDWHYLHAWKIAFDDPDLPWRVATPFPAHWVPLFTARGWVPTID